MKWTTINSATTYCSLATAIPLCRFSHDGSLFNKSLWNVPASFICWPWQHYFLVCACVPLLQTQSKCHTKYHTHLLLKGTIIVQDLSSVATATSSCMCEFKGFIKGLGMRQSDWLWTELCPPASLFYCSCLG